MIPFLRKNVYRPIKYEYSNKEIDMRAILVYPHKPSVFFATSHKNKLRHTIFYLVMILFIVLLSK